MNLISKEMYMEYSYSFVVITWSKRRHTVTSLVYFATDVQLNRTNYDFIGNRMELNNSFYTLLVCIVASVAILYQWVAFPPRAAWYKMIYLHFCAVEHQA